MVRKVVVLFVLRRRWKKKSPAIAVVDSFTIGHSWIREHNELSFVDMGTCATSHTAVAFALLLGSKVRPDEYLCVGESGSVSVP